MKIDKVSDESILELFAKLTMANNLPVTFKQPEIFRLRDILCEVQAGRIRDTEGCEYCRGEKPFYHEGSDRIEIFKNYDNYYLFFNVGFYKHTESINVCPKCGKLLTKDGE